MLRIALCQVNLPVGEIDANTGRIRTSIDEASRRGSDLVVFPELSVTGYPPEDLLLRQGFAREAEAAVRDLAADVHGVVVLVGFPEAGRAVHNAAAVLADGRVAAVYRKHFLPNYAVFDEQRYFTSGSDALVIEHDGHRIGVTICEDLWHTGGSGQWAAVDGGAELLVNLSASPYHRGKGVEREEMFGERATDYRCFVAFCNAVGGQDELVFDGHSVVIDPAGGVVARGRQFDEDMVVVDLELAGVAAGRAQDPRWRDRRPDNTDHVRVVSVPSTARARVALAPASLAVPLSPEAEVYEALVVGTGDYFRKNRFSHAVLGLSGGIDSALALVVAVDALGADAVTAVSMPSRFTAGTNREDGAELARRLGVRLLEIPIEDIATRYTAALASAFADTEPNVAEENLQARIRGNLVMALSNKFSWLVLTTGNKSEMSVGYATLYGDMAGGFAVIKDVFKTWVYRLSRWRNRNGEVIPQRIIDKAPSAELRENQLDSDSLPPYDVLDAILEAYVESDRSPSEIEARGFASAVVRQVVDLVDRAEYKRRQAPPGVRISTKAFGKDRRLPITHRYRPR
jgi:NAD+ synthase (glutamine-hydrolysing)